MAESDANYDTDSAEDDIIANETPVYLIVMDSLDDSHQKMSKEDRIDIFEIYISRPKKPHCK